MDSGYGWVKEHWGKLAGMGGVGAGGLMFLVKDTVREWWSERRADHKAALDEKRLQHGFGDKLANELLAILREDLRGNAAVLKDLSTTMGEFRDVMRSMKEQSAETKIIALETRESQKWLERRYGREMEQ